MSGRDNLRVAAAVKGVGRPRIEECLELVGLADRAKHRFHTYSLGMKQRLALAATMLDDPELMSRMSEALRGATAYLPLHVFEDLGNSLVHYPKRLAAVNESRAERGLEPLEFLDLEVSWSLRRWPISAIFLVIAFLGMRKRDL